MKRTTLYLVAVAVAGIAIGVCGNFLANFVVDRQVQRWRELTILRSTGKDLPKSVLCEIKSYGKLPLHVVLALGYAETKGDPEAVSKDGAVGWMQVMPATAAEYGYTSEEMFDPVKCCDAGMRHYYKMLEVFGGNEHNAVAAYNVGESGWKTCMNEKRIPGETRRLLGRYNARTHLYRVFLRDGVVE